MEPYLELINYIAPPAIKIPPVEVSMRRRLFGGDYPSYFVGNSFRIFGGHDYGYVLPRTAFNGNLKEIMAWTQKNTYLGAAITAALAIGNYTFYGPWKALRIFAFFVIANELYTWLISYGASKVSYEQLLEGFIQSEKAGGLGFDAGRTPQALAKERYQELQQGESRLISGSSILYAALAGWAVATSGVFLFDSVLWPSRKAALSFGVGNAVIINFIWMWWQEKQSGITSGVAHNQHFIGVEFGFLLGYFDFFRNLILG